MSKMKRLNLKIKDFKEIAFKIKDLNILLNDLDFDYPYQTEERKPVTDKMITKLETKLQDLKAILPTFTLEEYNIFPTKDKHYILKLKVCPFCKRNIRVLKTETYCIKCKFLFREGE